MPVVSVRSSSSNRVARSFQGLDRRWIQTGFLLVIFFIVLLREIYKDTFKTLDPPYRDIDFDPPSSTVSLESLPLPIHVVFTSFSGRKSKREIEANTLFWWIRLHFRVKFLTLDDHQIDHNDFGVPVLSSLYRLAMQQFPRADTYTYINADIVATTAFVHTADFVVNASRAGWLKPRFLVVGQRTNVESNGIPFTEKTDLNSLLKKGVYDRTDAEDYFIVSPTAFDWNSIPDFVIGRPAYDNWLVNAAFYDPDIDLIDATNTNPVMHQMDKGGKTEWGGKQLQMKDTFYNYKLGRGAWIYGTVKCSKWATFWQGDTIAIKKRMVESGWGQKSQDPTAYLERQW